MVEKMRRALRLTGTALDDEIKDAIEACKKDLYIAGVEKIDETDPLIIAAISHYCRAEFDFCGKGEQYMKSYVNIKTALALSGDYNA